MLEKMATRKRNVGDTEESGLREAINKRTLSLPMIRVEEKGRGLVVFP